MASMPDLTEPMKRAGMAYDDAGNIVDGAGAVLARAGADAERLLAQGQNLVRQNAGAAFAAAQQAVKAGSPYVQLALTEAQKAAGLVYDEAGNIVNEAGTLIAAAGGMAQALVKQGVAEMAGGLEAATAAAKAVAAEGSDWAIRAAAAAAPYAQLALSEACKAAGMAYNEAGQIVNEGGEVLAQAGADAAKLVATVAKAGREDAAKAAEVAKSIAAKGTPYAKPVLTEGMKAAGMAYNAGGQIVNEAGAVLAQAGGDAKRLVAQCTEVGKEGAGKAAEYAKAVAAAGSPYAKIVITEAMKAAGLMLNEAGLLVNAAGKYVNMAGEVVSLAAAQGLQAARAGMDTLSPYVAQGSATAAQLLSQMGSGLGDAGAAAYAGAASAAAGAGAAIAEGAGEAKEFASEAGSAVAGAATDFYNSPAVQSAAGATFEAVGDAYAMSREELAGAMAAVTGLAAAAFDFVKFDVIRDFFQTIGLFFANIASVAIVKAKAFFGNLSNLVAFDIGFLTNQKIPDSVIYVLIAIVAILLIGAFSWMICQAKKRNPDEIRDGHEVKTWDQQADESKKTVKAMKLILTACFSAYLPVSRVVMQIFACAPNVIPMLNKIEASAAASCGDHPLYIYFVILAVILLLAFTIYLPVFAYKLIAEDKPVGSLEDPNMRYDEDGNPQEYTDEMYNDDVLHNPKYVNSPFQFMYKGYERKWAFYKVFVMVFKFLLTLPVIFLATELVGQTIATMIVLLIFGVASKVSSPFIADTADHMDFSGRITALATVLFALIGGGDSAKSEDDQDGVVSVMNILINLANTINIVIMAFMVLIALPKFQLWWKNLTGKLVFSDTTKDCKGPADKIIPGWDIKKECKHRIWHPFWDSVILNVGGEEVAKRLAELKQITANNGRKNIVNHFKALQTPGWREWRVWVQQNLEGVDVFWDGIPADGVLDSKTCFGKMYVQPYPFHCVMVYDDSDDYTFVREQDFGKFVQRNQEPDIVGRRQRRVMLRALVGKTVHLEHVQMETHSVPDGTETYTDSEGNTQTRQRMTSVEVEMHYHRGTLNVGNNKSGSDWAAGFKPSIHYDDGEGVAIAPHTGEHHQIRSSTTIGGEAMGVVDTMADTPRLRELFTDPENEPQWRAGVPVWEAKCREYRDGLMKERHEKELVLNSGFWLNVYDHYAKPREALEHYFRTYENNEKIKALPDAHREGLAYLYHRINYVMSHPCAGLWFTFFDDVWENNKDMKAFQGKDDFFDVRKADCIAYQPCSRAALEEKLKGQDLLDDSKLFSKDVLDAFFGTMDEVNTQVKNGTFGRKPAPAAGAAAAAQA